MTPEEAEAALTRFLLGQASLLLASARYGGGATSTWKEWEDEWQGMLRALHKTWREQSAPQPSGPTGPPGSCDCLPKRTPHAGCDHLFRDCLDEEGQEGEKG